MTDQTENQTVALAIRRVTDTREIITVLRNPATIGGLVTGIDYGVIPGTGDKPTLLLPGMEKLCRALNAEPEYDYLDEVRDWDDGFFAFEFECTLRDVSTGEVLPGGRGVGSCNSKESGFAWRWVRADQVPYNHHDLEPEGLQTKSFKATEFVFAVNDPETTGKYGKPQSYWDKFNEAIENGTAVKAPKETRKGKSYDAWTIEDTLYRVPNPDIYDQVNAILKRAKKRALGDAIKGAANVSEYFTVDLEDNAGSATPQPENVIDGKFEDVTDPSQSEQLTEEQKEHQQEFIAAVESAGFQITQVADWFDLTSANALMGYLLPLGWEGAMSEIVELAVLGEQWFQTRKVLIKSKERGDPNSSRYYEFDLGFGEKQRARVWTRQIFRDAGYDVSAWDKIGIVRIDPAIGLKIQRNDKGFLDVSEVAVNPRDGADDFVDIPE